MIQLLPGVALLILCIYLFVREVKHDNKKYREADRLGDEHIMREIEKFVKEKRLATPDKADNGVYNTVVVKTNSQL